MKTQFKPFLVLIALAAILASFGCATSGGTMDASDKMDKASKADKPMASAKVDYTQEMGANGLPTPRALVARYIDAVGGAEALRSGKYATMKGKMMMPAMGMEGEMMIQTMAPNKMVMNIEMAGFGSMNTGYDGSHGWVDNPMSGPQLLEGKQLTEMKRQADFNSEFNYERDYPTQETLAEVDFNGAPAYKVRLVDTEGSESIQYFDKASHFLVGSEGKQTSDMGEMEVSTVMSDYKAFGPVKMPTKTVVKMMGMEIQQSVSEVSFEPIPVEAFAPPEAIQKLIDSE